MEYKNGLLEQLKKIIAEYYDFEEKKVRDIGLKGESLDEERKALLDDIIDLCLNTKYLNEETKLYLELSDVGIPYLGDVILRRTGREINYNTLSSKIHFCGRKLTKDLGSNIIIDLRDKRKLPMDEYIERVADLRVKYKKFDTLDSKLAINIKDIKVNNKRFEPSEIREVLSKLEPYTVKNVDGLFNSHEKEIIGYLKYVSGSNLMDEDTLKIKRFMQTM